MRIGGLATSLREDIARFGLFVLGSPLLLMIAFGISLSRVNRAMCRFYLRWIFGVRNMSNRDFL